MPSIRHGRRVPRTAPLAALLLLVGAAPPPASADGHAPEEAAGRTIVFAGDIILGGAVNAFAADRGPAALLAQVPELREADLAIANLESVATAHGVRRAEKGGLMPFHFRARPETLQVLAAAGIDAVATANNHSGDYGPAALIEHQGLLEGLGIAHVGSGRTAAEACAPVYLDAGVALGPLTLVGFRVDQDRAYLPQLVEVDTYWRIERAVSDSHWIATTGSTDDGRLGAWTSHHEPCDWAWPTPRWTPGVIYHDRSTLRPPADALSGLGAAQVASGLLGSLEVSVGVTRDGVEIARTGQLDGVGLGAPLAVQLLVGAVVAALGVVAARLAWRRQQRGR